MSTFFRIVTVLAGVCLFSGCAIEQPGGEDVGETEAALITTNTITTNTITTNTITTNTITTNTLTSSTFTPGGPGAQVLAALQDTTPTGAANRTVFHYLVGCALNPSQSVTYTYSDAVGDHTVTETGAIGLAPDWATGPLDDLGKSLVSSCMATRVNYYGVTVDISLRADVDVLTDNTSAAELGAYSYIEGAFWGDLFSDTPYLRSCYRAENVDHSRSAMRDCAAGHLNSDGTVTECGIVHIVGSCTDVCKKMWKQTGYFTHCGGDDVTASDQIITVGLQ